MESTMRAKLVVFPIKGNQWCFSRSIDSYAIEALSSNIPSTFAELWNRISKSAIDKPHWSNLELFIDFAANKMSNQWSNLEKAPAGSFKSKIHGLGLRLLSGVKPSEIFLKSITKEVNQVEIVYPSRVFAKDYSMLPQDVHKKYLYGSASLLPLTMIFMVLPMPNIPFFWILFRTYSHWRALQGSERLLRLVTNCPNNQKSNENTTHTNRSTKVDSGKCHKYQETTCVLSPSDELQKLVYPSDATDDLNERNVDAICQRYNLNKMDVDKYKHSF